jgi:hypothetical protein
MNLSLNPIGGRIRSVGIVATLAVLAAPLTAQAAFVPFPETPSHRISVNNVVRAVVIGDGVAYVGGDFSSASGSNGSFPRERVAAFDLNTGAVLPFRADANGIVRALAISGTSLFVGGDFSTISGVSRTRLAEVATGTGTPQTAFRVNANGAVRALAARAGRLYVGGNFGTLGGVTQRRLGAVDLGTRTLDTSFNPVVDNTVLALSVAPDGSKVFAGGAFRTIDGQPRNYLAGLTAGGDLSGPAFDQSDNYPILALDTNDTGSRVFAAIGGAGNQAASFNTATGSRMWRQRADGDVQAVTHQGDNVYFGFHEGFGGNPDLRLLAADATSGQLESAFQPPINSYWGIRALDATDRGLLAGGEFTTVNGAENGRAGFFDVLDGPEAPQNTQLVPAGASWRFRDTGSEAIGWRQPGFNDDGWGVGSAQLGYGDGDEATVVSYGPSASSKYITTYFRHQFTWDGSHDVQQLVASLVADDGAVVYLNGEEVVRDNLPTGSISAATLASTGRSGSAENASRTFTLDPTDLVIGSNTLAVEVHQDYRGSSDLSFDLSLHASD